MRQTVSKRIRKQVRAKMRDSHSSRQMENLYRKEKREYVRKRGRQFPKLKASKRQQRLNAVM